MLSFTELRRMSRARIDDAKALYAAGRYDGAVYVCGYAVEFKLKARVATTLLAQGAWPETDDDFKKFGKIKSHNLEELIALCDRSAVVASGTNKILWSFVLSRWGPSVRYTRVGATTEQDAREMIESVEKLVRKL